MGRIKLRQTLNINKYVPHICWLPFSRSDWTQAYLNSSRWWQFILSVLDTDVQNTMEGWRVGKGNKAQHNKHCSIWAALIVRSCSFSSRSVLSLSVCLSSTAKVQKHIRIKHVNGRVRHALNQIFVFTCFQKTKSPRHQQDTEMKDHSENNSNDASPEHCRNIAFLMYQTGQLLNWIWCQY